MSTCISQVSDFHGDEYEDYYLLDVTTYNLLCKAFWRNLPFLADHKVGVAPKSNN
jgi:hypothetical protein